MCSSPELWEDADVFKPERFPVDQPVPNEATHDFKYLPFGGGKRKCIGEPVMRCHRLVSLGLPSTVQHRNLLLQWGRRNTSACCRTGTVAHLFVLMPSLQLCHPCFVTPAQATSLRCWRR